MRQAKDVALLRPQTTPKRAAGAGTYTTLPVKNAAGAVVTTSLRVDWTG